MKELVPSAKPELSAWTSKLVPKGIPISHCKTEIIEVLAPKVTQVGTTSMAVPEKARKWSHRTSTDRIRTPYKMRKLQERRERRERQEHYDFNFPWNGYPLLWGGEPPPLVPFSPAMIHPVPLYPVMYLTPPLPLPYMSPVFPSPAESETKEEAAKKQLAYYFSKGNLVKDVHLRSMFDPNDGGVLLAELIQFTKLARLLGDDVSLLHKIVTGCDFVELADVKEVPERAKVRVKEWKTWVLAKKGCY